MTSIINTDPNMTQPQLNEAVTHWMEAVKTSMTKNTPVKKTKTTQKTIYNKTIKAIQWRAKKLVENSLTQGWDRIKYIEYRKLRQDLIDECKRQNDRNWTKTIQNLNILHKDPTQFWKNLKKLKGNQTITKPYLISNNIKIFKTEGKEQILRNIWENIFKISPEENQLYEDTVEDTVNNYLTNNSLLTSPLLNGNPQKFKPRPIFHQTDNSGRNQTNDKGNEEQFTRGITNKQSCSTKPTRPSN